MKRLLANIFLFLFLLAVVNNIIFYSLRLPFCWGNDAAYAKAHYLLDHKTEYNTVFIGPSRTYWQIDVAAFDSLTNHKTQSFNFGIDAISAPEIFYYAQNLAQQDKNIRYAFIEVNDVVNLPPDRIYSWNNLHWDNLHSRRSKYWFNFTAFKFTNAAILSSNYNKYEKFTTVCENTLAFGEWLFKFDLLGDALNFKASKPNPDYLGYHQTGFMPVNESMDDLPAHIESRQLLLTDTTINERLKAASIEAFAVNSMKVNTAYYNNLNAIVKNLQTQNIQVFLILAPRSTHVQYSNVVPAFTKISDCPKINLANANSYPEFYNLKFVYDIGHLNKQGDSIYTTKIAEAFNESTSRK